MRYSLCRDVGISENGGTYLTYGIKVFCKEGVKLIDLQSLNSIMFTYTNRYKTLLQNINL